MQRTVLGARQRRLRAFRDLAPFRRHQPTVARLVLVSVVHAEYRRAVRLRRGEFVRLADVAAHQLLDVALELVPRDLDPLLPRLVLQFELLQGIAISKSKRFEFKTLPLRTR